MTEPDLQRVIKFLESSQDYQEIGEDSFFSVQLKYATPENFMGRNVYGPFNRAFLHRIAFEKLKTSAKKLQAEKPGFRYLIYDALRPRSTQRVLWSFVKGTPEQEYVADPDKGSVHNFGFAVDLTIIDQKGHPLDMGTGFDDFREMSQPRFEKEYLEKKLLTEEHLENRTLLRKTMTAGGFRGIPHEWWHFEALPREEIRSKYQIIE